jgi:GT2 family glycosyltransferase
MRTFVIIPTIGRAQCVCDALKWLERQTARPAGIVVIGVSPEDIEGVEAATDLPVEALLWDIGSSSQRNRGLHHIHGRADIALFLDDDFIPLPTYIEDMEKLFEDRPDIVGMTGRMIEDGIHGTGISFATATTMIERDQAPEKPELHARQGLYGCNMAIRLAAATGVRFDERLKFYGWQEDIDFSFQIGKRGCLVKYDKLGGVHMGIKRGRTSGRRFGYSQIANPVYLLKKQTIPQARAYKIMWRNVASNLLRSIRPEPHIDRHGRLAGNMLALKDLLLGRLRPERIVDL